MTANQERKIDICVIGIVGLPANYGGFETLAENLSQDNRLALTVYCSSKSYSQKLQTFNNAKLVYLPIKANGVQSVIYDIVSILHGIIQGKRKFLILGVSGAIIIPAIKLLIPNLKIIVNVDGIEWKREKWSKTASNFLKLSEKIASKHSDKVIADNDAIKVYLDEQYSIDALTIPYGGDQFSHLDNNFDTTSQDRQERYALTICRIEPENNVHVILEAFSEMKMIKIKFVGNWSANRYSQDLKNKYKDDPWIELIDAVYDSQIIHSLRKNCEIYIHGHSAGGTNPSLVEIMHHEKLIFAFECNYNRATLNNLGLYFKNKDDLIIKLQEYQKNPQDNHFKSEPKKIKEYAEKLYTWIEIRERYYQTIVSIS